jgi:hypothetical protein
VVVGASVDDSAEAAVVVGADVADDLLSLPHATNDNERMPAMTSRRLTGFTDVSPSIGP